MTKTYVTADLHFGHANMMKFNPATRPYTDAIHMNESLVLAWNSIVQPEDLTYILGDVAFCHADKATAYVRRLNGRKILIEGNHDHKLLQDKTFRGCFEDIHVYHEVNVDGTKVCMFHYPIYEWNQCHRGSVHMFGHQHGNGGPMKNRSMDVGMDATGVVVSDMSILVKQLLKLEMQGHH